MGRKRLCIGWTRLLICLPILVLITHLISVMYLRRETNVENMSRVKQKKFDHLVLGLAAGEGWPGRLQCQGNKALNKTRSGKNVKFKTVDRVAFVTVFAIYNTPEGRGPVDLVKVGNDSYDKMDRSMGILNVFINFIQVTMPQSNVIILTDPASEIPLHRDMVTIQTIQGEYSRDKLMLQRISSYIVRAIEKQHILVILIPSELASYGHAFLESRLEKLTQNPEQVTHYIFTDSDIAVVDDLGHIFTENPNFDVALTFRNNKQQPLNSGFIAVRGTSEGIRRGKSFLQAVLEIYSSKFMKASRMLGDQLALAWIVTSEPNFNARKFSKGETFTEKIAGASVLFLPCSVYNWTPPEGAGQFHGMPLDVKVVHFKGSRKRLMLESWNYFSSTSDISDMLCLILRSGRTKYDF